VDHGGLVWMNLNLELGPSVDAPHALVDRLNAITVGEVFRVAKDIAAKLQNLLE